jgi:hypothetical protein
LEAEMEFEHIDLPRESVPPPELKPAIAAQLRRVRLLRSRRPLIAIAAAFATAVIAVLLFMRHPAPKANYILLLYESPQFARGNRGEYGDWARHMRPLIVGGEELDQRPLLAVSGSNTSAPSQQPRLAGYFLIDAPDDAAAERVARACPHLRHGGAIVLRKIVL